jgi:hypothetical protein
MKPLYGEKMSILYMLITLFFIVLSGLCISIFMLIYALSIGLIYIFFKILKFFRVQFIAAIIYLKSLFWYIKNKIRRIK